MKKTILLALILVLTLCLLAGCRRNNNSVESAANDVSHAVDDLVPDGTHNSTHATQDSHNTTATDSTHATRDNHNGTATDSTHDTMDDRNGNATDSDGFIDGGNSDTTGRSRRIPRR